jgi:hypothetical protein
VTDFPAILYLPNLPSDEASAFPLRVGKESGSAALIDTV